MLPKPSTQKVGAIPATFGVSIDGQATYTVPLKVPPGTGGLQPDLSLEYSSAGGNGDLGPGWSLRGAVSRIARCNRTLAQDGVAAAPAFRPGDVYCLDGQRLTFETSADEDLGATTCEFPLGFDADGVRARTEVDTLSRVQVTNKSPFPCDALGVDKFEVRTKSGLIETYDNWSNVDALLFFGPKDNYVRRRLEDRAGNFIEYAIINSPFQQALNGGLLLVPASIAYSGHGKFGAADYKAPDAEISFVHEPRLDKPYAYNRGVADIIVHRLSTIRMKLGTRTVREYRMTYSMSAGEHPVSLLKQVEECVPDAASATGNLVCTPPTTFSYEHEGEAAPHLADVEVFGSDPGGARDAIPGKPEFGLVYDLLPIVADMDGDGFDDALLLLDDNPGQDLSPQHWELIRGKDHQRVVSPAGSIPWEGGATPSRFNVIDYNNDGRDDLIIRNHIGDGTYRIMSLAADNASFQIIQTNVPYEREVAPETEPAGAVAWTYILDVDGDGLRDVVTCAGPQKGPYHWTYFHVPFLAPDNVSGTIINQLNNGCMSHSLVADLDGDGADELLIKHFINDDDQRSEYDGIKFQITPSGGMNAFAIQTGVHVEPREGVYGFALDANGDGLTDVAVHEHDALFIYINSGSARDAHRFSDGLIFFLSFNGQPIVTRLRSPSGLALAVGPVIDEDGDGRDDIIVYPVDPDPSHPRPNAGVLRAHSLLNNSSTDFPRFVDNFEYHELSGIPSNPDFARSVAMDMNGDGIKDLVTRLDFDKAPGDFHSFVRTGTSLPKLTKIQDGLGSKKSIFYANLTSSIYTPGAAACSYPERCAHPRHQAIDSVLTEDNMALSNLRAFVYHYSGARTGLRGRGWLGFASVGMEELAHGFKETTFYDQSRFTLATEPTRTIYPFLGIPKRHVSFIDLGSDRQMMLDRVMQPAVLHNSGELHLIPYVGQVTASTHDLVGATQDLSLGTVQRTMTPDKFGNAKSETVTSFARGGATVDTLRTDNKYVYEDTPQYVDAWLVGALRRQTTTDTTPNGTDSHTLVYEYDPLRPGLVASGTLEPDRSQYKLVTSYLDRDRFGNVQKIEGKGGDEVRTDLLAWDDRGVFPTSMTDAEGYVTTRVFDTALGAAVETDQRGAGVARTLVSLAVPDGFGRVRTLSGPDGVETTLDYSAAVVSGTTPIRLRVAMLRAGQTSVTEYDPAGRPTQSQTNTLNGALLTGKMSYDVFGRLESASRPSMSGAGPATTYSYDNADRLVASTTPDTATWERCYGGLTSCVRDPRGHTSCRTTDVIGRATFESDPNDDPTESCQTVADRIESAPASFPGAHYVFGPFGALKEIATTNGGRSITPDAFGRPVAQSDQTSGTREFVYDPFGQLTDVADDNQNEAHFSHDKIGRMISRLDRGGVTPDPSGVLTQWVWRRDLQGRLDRTTTPETTAVFDYDEFGRTNTISRMIDGEPFTAHVDERGAAGRPTIISYPAGTGAGSLRVRNVYDIAGTLIEVKNADDANVSYWKLTDVNSFGQVKTESFPNGLTTSRAYDGTVGRPQSITTGSLQNETYLYYLHGSLKEYNDITNSQDLTYKYDRYDRLTSSSTASTTVESFDYDLVGNLKLNSGRTYEYKNPAHSQWLTDISSPSGSSTLGYDNVGNVKTRSGDLLSNFTIDYTPSNRPKTLTLANGGGSVSYTYDADQVRVQKKGGATTRTYFDGFYYRTDDGSHPVHVFLIGNGARIVAEVVRTETDTGLDEKTYFLHDDVLLEFPFLAAA